MDGSTTDVPDSKANAEYFGRPSNATRDGAFPQVRWIVAAESGTGALIGATLGPYTVGEQSLARDLLGVFGPDMLVLADRNFLCHTLARDVLATGAHLLWRASASFKLTPIAVLADGSYLAQLHPRRTADGPPITVQSLRSLGTDNVDLWPARRRAPGRPRPRFELPAPARQRQGAPAPHQGQPDLRRPRTSTSRTRTRRGNAKPSTSMLAAIRSGVPANCPQGWPSAPAGNILRPQLDKQPTTWWEPRVAGHRRRTPHRDRGSRRTGVASAAGTPARARPGRTSPPTPGRTPTWPARRHPRGSRSSAGPRAASPGGARPRRRHAGTGRRAVRTVAALRR